MKENSCNCEECKLKNLFYTYVTEDHLDTICARKMETGYKQGDIIINEDDPIKDFIYLKSGLVKLSRKTNDEKEQIISFAKPFDFVSLLSVFSSNNYNYSVTAIEDCVTCTIDLKNIRDMATDNGLFALNLIKQISKATDRIIMDNMEIRRKHLRGRIAHILLYFSKSIYNSTNFELPVSRREIAEYIGMTTENVIRTLSEFRKDKILRIYGKEIEITDMKRLESISIHG